ncbi:unknown [Bacteroides sp. CAG:1060]|nr:unknown [Bacteroides sp. CAG:1060]
MILDILLAVSLDLCLDSVADSFLEAELTRRYGHRNHDFRLRMESVLLKFSHSGEDGPVLSLGNKRIGYMKTHSAKTHHRVHLMKALTSLDNFFNLDSKLVGKLLLLVDGLRHELMKRWVKQTEHYRLAIHNLKSALN